MSNKLKKKSKKMQPAGYSKTSLLSMKENAKRKSNSEAIITETHCNVRLIAYDILHDKYTFGQKRIIRVEETINAYMNAMAEGEMTTESLEFYLKEKAKINVREEVNKIPFNERFALTTVKVDMAYKPTAGMHILATIYDYFVLLGVCLKSQFGFSKNKILGVYEWIRDYINTLSRYEQFDLKIEDIAEYLVEEIKYCDERFVKNKDLTEA